MSEKMLLHLLSLFNQKRRLNSTRLVALIVESLIQKKNLFNLSNEFVEKLITELIEACKTFSLANHWSMVYEKAIELVFEKRNKL